MGCSNENKSYRVYILVTRCIMESRKVVFTEVYSHLLQPPSEESRMQACGHDQVDDNKGHNFVIDSGFLRDIRDYTLRAEFFSSASADHITTSRRPENPQVAEIVERISEVTREDMLQEGTLGLPQEGSQPGGGILEGVPQKGDIEQSEQTLSPGDTPWKHCSLDHRHPNSMGTRAAARSFTGRNASYSSNSTHFVAITTENTLSLLRQLEVYTKTFLPDITHHIYEEESAGEYAHITTGISRRSAGKKAEIVMNSFKEAMTLSISAKAQWKAASDKEVASLEKKAYAFCSITLPPAYTKSSVLDGSSRPRPTA